jgi:ferritin-like protein
VSSESYHEPVEVLSEVTRDMHRAIVSLKEELEAVDWYQQRAEACSDEELRGVLVHNKNEEIEHAMMNLEWIRRHSEVFDTNVKRYIGAKGPILAVERAETLSNGADAASGSSSPSLGIGSLRGAK